MAHEQAHQRGTGPELEAAFLGYLVALRSPSLHAQYSAAFFAQARLLGYVRRVDREEYRRLYGAILPGVLRDWLDLRDFWEQYEGVAETVATAVNDRYLRANRVAGGVHNYDLVVRLLVEFSRQRRD